MDPPKLNQKLGQTPLRNLWFRPTMDHFMDIFSQFQHEPPTYEEKALTPLKISELLSSLYPP